MAEDGSTIPTFTTWKATGTLAAAWGVGSYPSCPGCRQWCGAARASLTEALGRQWQLAAGPRLSAQAVARAQDTWAVGASQLRPQEPVSARPGCVRSGWLGRSPSRSGRVQGCSRANGGPTPERTMRGLLTATAVTRHGRSHVPHRVEGLVAALTAGRPIPTAGPPTVPWTGAPGEARQWRTGCETQGSRGRAAGWPGATPIPAWGAGRTSRLTGHRPSLTRLRQIGGSLPVTSPPTRREVMSVKTGGIQRLRLTEVVLEKST